MVGTNDAETMRASAGARLTLIAASYRRLTGRPLAPGVDDDRLAAALWDAPFAILAHGTEPDPRFFYANARALGLFETDAARLLGLPSRYSAEPDDRESRAAMFARLESDDIVAGYEGVRVSAEGRRFRVIDAAIWNVRDDQGSLVAQAARLERCEPIVD